MTSLDNPAQAVIGRPDPVLGRLVSSYVGYRYEGFAPGIHLGLPSASLTVVLTLGAPVDVVEMPAPDQSPGRFPTLASGLTTRRAVMQHDGNQYGIQLDVTPLGARSMLGLPSAALGPAVVGLDELWGPSVEELRERLAAASTWPERFALLDDALRRRTGQLPPPAAELVHAWDLLVAGGGQMRVADVAYAVGWSRRHLGERFAREYGVTPKDLARMVRFAASRRLLQRTDVPSIAAVAARSGYYDQSHLVRDWQDFAGCAPTRWLDSEELPFVQDDAS